MHVLYYICVYSLCFIMEIAMIIVHLPKRISQRADLDSSSTTYIVALFLCYRLV